MSTRQNRVVFFLVALSTLLSSSLVLSAESGPPKQNVEHYMYYWEKGNRGEQISIEEFKFLMSELEKKVTDLKAAFSKISIAGPNFSYRIGKVWEIKLELTNENIEAALKYINALKDNPNSMRLSLILYLYLKEVSNSAYDFERIKDFETTFSDTHVYLGFWCTAFQKAHLIPLAAARDMHLDLYRMKK